MSAKKHIAKPNTVESKKVWKDLHKMNYYKRHWDETTGNELTDSWGTSTYYFETDENNYVLRQVELYNNGIGLKYWEQYLQDDFGKLAENLLNPEDFEPYRIEKDEFEKVWATDYKNP